MRSEVDPEKLRADLEITGGLLMSESVATALSATLGRSAAQDVVARAARDERPFRDALLDVPEVADALGPEGVDACPRSGALSRHDPAADRPGPRMPARLNHRLEGPPDGPPLILTGSLGTELSMWDPQMPPLAERFRVLRYDLRGHGASEVPPGPYSFSDLGHDLLALMDELEIERASLCGLSIGGMISMWLAAHAPERVERLVLFCTSAYLGSAYAERAAAVRERGLEPIADAVIERWFTPGFDPEVDGALPPRARGHARRGVRGLLRSHRRHGPPGRSRSGPRPHPGPRRC